MIQLKTLNKKQLAEFVSSGDFEKYDFLPITAHRAKSHINNPKAKDEQTLLILAFENEDLAGYIGCFPDEFNIKDNRFSYAWLSTLFISEKFRGKRIAQQLLNKVFEEYNGNIAITEFTKEAESLYNKIGIFNYIEPKVGKRFYFKTDLATIIPVKKPKFKSIQPLFSIADGVFNGVVSLKNIGTKKPNFKFEILEKPDEESTKFINQFESNRNTDDFKWMIENPWVLEGKKPDERYLFSSFSQVFKYFWVKIYNENNELICCSLLLLRDGHLKISYLFSNNNLDRFVDFLGWFVTKNKVKILTSYQTQLNEAIKNKSTFPKIYERDLERRYMFHQSLIKNLPENFNPNFQDGDGDCVMT